MIRTIPDFDPRDAAQAMRLADARARIVHEDYLAGQRAAKKEQFGSAPAEVEWERLGESLRDDNRNAADHIEYKLARVGLRAMASPEVVPFKLDQPTVRELVHIEHARWTAAKNVAGFRYGKKRDDHHHPDLIPFDDLSSAAQDKDLDVVSAIPKMLAAGGQQVEYVRSAKKGEEQVVRECLILDPAALANAEAQLASINEIAVLIGPAGRNMLSSGDAVSARLASVLSQAYEIRHLSADHLPKRVQRKEKADA
jgi:hypothetical protein